MKTRRFVLAAVLAAVVIALSVYTGKYIVLLALLGPAVIAADNLRRREDASAEETAPEPEAPPELPQKLPVLILGTGMTAVRMLAEISKQEDCPWQVAGLVDETGTHAKNTVNGVRVLATLSELPMLLPEIGAEALIIAARLEEERFAAACRMAHNAGLTVLCLPEEKRNSLSAGIADLITLSN